MRKKIGLTKNGIEEECTILDGTCSRHVVHRGDMLSKSQLSAKELKLFADMIALSSDTYTDSTGAEIRTHHEDKCSGQYCSIHNPSKHLLWEAPTVWDNENKMMNRVCTHGVSHPDYDDVTYNVGILGKDEASHVEHECDGCCGNYHLEKYDESFTAESDLLPWTGMSLKEARSKLSGLHFAKEQLSDGEREILYIAEALLKRIDEINGN